MDRRELNKHQWVNTLQSAVLLLGLMGLLGLIGLLIAGPWYGLTAMVAVGLLYLFHPSIPPLLVMRMYRARQLSRLDTPVLSDVMDELTARAGLPQPPALFYIPSPMVSAFSVGDRRNAAIALSDGLLRQLNLREVVTVLGHELSHVANNDLRTMTFADLSARVTSLLSLLGLLLLVINLPLMFLDEAVISWPAIALLVFAPTISTLLQLGLSRSREYQADLGAAALTGDPAGMAQALQRMEQAQGGLWEQVLLPGRRVPEPSWLRTHPPTERRIERLKALEAEIDEPPLFEERGYDVRSVLRSDLRRPRWHIGGLWF